MNTVRWYAQCISVPGVLTKDGEDDDDDLAGFSNLADAANKADATCGDSLLPLELTSVSGEIRRIMIGSWI